jgi:hypothetical protein
MRNKLCEIDDAENKLLRRNKYNERLLGAFRPKVYSTHVSHLAAVSQGPSETAQLQ